MANGRLLPSRLLLNLRVFGCGCVHPRGMNTWQALRLIIPVGHHVTIRKSRARPLPQCVSRPAFLLLFRSRGEIGNRCRLGAGWREIAFRVRVPAGAVQTVPAIAATLTIAAWLVIFLVALNGSMGIRGALQWTAQYA
jgi:hypothetical protein